jgi:hypothetical protein
MPKPKKSKDWSTRKKSGQATLVPIKRNPVVLTRCPKCHKGTSTINGMCGVCETVKNSERYEEYVFNQEKAAIHQLHKRVVAGIEDTRFLTAHQCYLLEKYFGYRRQN